MRASRLNPGTIDRGRAEKRLRVWKSQQPFDQDGYFARRLELDQTTEAEMLQLLGQTSAHHGEVLPWARELEEAFARINPAVRSFPGIWDGEGKEDAGFLTALRPIVDQALNRLHTEAQKLVQSRDASPFDADSIPAIFFPHLRRRLLAMLNRTMVLELNIARLEGHLDGETSEERFHSFLQRLQDREATLKLLREYPVLARQIMVRIEQWLTFSLEFLGHLCTDWDKIRSEFFSDCHPGTLVEVQGNAGDNHRNGRSVLISRFSGGAKLVYKPRSLTLDIHFQELLQWINERGSHAPFRTLGLLDCQGHGWAEFITATSCKSEEEVRLFYERQGGYLALLYALEASDFHMENVIAAGEHPVLIDLEALFHPRMGEGLPDSADERTARVLNYSVLRIGLLPRRIFGDEESNGIDVSGLGGASGQLTPNAVLSLEASGTDEMRFTRRRLPMLDQANRPALRGAEIDIQGYGDAIVAGFVAIYDLLLKYRDALLSPDGPIARFSNDRVRVLLRPTEVYSVLLWESLHPDVLRDALERDRLFDHLWMNVEDCPYLERVIAAERHDLLVGDVPIFTTLPSTRTVWSSTEQKYDEFFEQSGLEMVAQHLRQMDAADMDRQIWFIRASLTSLSLAETTSAKTRRTTTVPTSEVSRERLIAHATRVGDRLKELALESKESVSWVGIGLENERSWSILPLGPKLYDGLPGIMLFLAYLGSVTGRDDYTVLAKAALVTLRRQLTESLETMPIGAYSGIGGIIYVLCHLSVLWKDDALLYEATKLVDRLPEKIEKDAHLDIIGGAAGCLAVLIALYRAGASDHVRSIAIQCGDHLIRKARPMPQGVGWVSKGVAEKPLTGLSHGGSGIALALSRLAAVTGEDRFHRTALEAIVYERSLFLPEAANWPDLRRELEPGAHCSVMWCHGAPGIGLARLDMLEQANDGEFRIEAETALQTTLADGFGFSHCLCHGDLGNLEAILQASSVLPDPLWKTELNRLVAVTLHSIEEDGWLCGTPSNVETPGFMTGLAGIGYQLLRLAEPSRVPSVLCLAPPA
ncbi:MAG TPA: type 2 lanthipeptide synthetase LanM family protein [Candidatus Angelobacter sp.]|nr:type 2 lanthipeptide synthetase LanM family protein [Candidatus Angelobacter sp.]